MNCSIRNQTLIGMWNPLQQHLMKRLLLITLALWLPASYAGTHVSSHLLKYLEATKQPSLAKQLPLNEINSIATDEKSVDWPIASFLSAELLRLQGATELSVKGYRRLMEWAISEAPNNGNTYNTFHNSSALTAIAAWRWLELIYTNNLSNKQNIEWFAKHIYPLRKTPLIQGMFSSPILGHLPQIQEEGLRLLAILAYRNGLKKIAHRTFVSYLKVASTATLDEDSQHLMTELANAGYSLPRVQLLRGKRLYNLKRYANAKKVLETAYDSDDLPVRAEAGLYLAQIMRINNKPFSQIVALLSDVINDAADPDIAQQALFNQAIFANRVGESRNHKLFVENMHRIIDEFPNGDYQDDALYQLARDAQDSGDIQQALQYYHELRKLPAGHDWENSAFFKPAQIHYMRSLSTTDKKGHLEKALALLVELEQRNPNGELHLPALFWQGRIHEDIGNKDKAKETFSNLVDEARFDYYGIRAAMHLNVGPNARTMLWPDDATQKQLKTHAKSKQNIQLKSDIPSFQRLIHALDSGLYKASSQSELTLRKLYPSQRIETLPLNKLNANQLSSLSLFYALRQLAISTYQQLKKPEQRLGLIQSIIDSGKDIPFAMNLLITGAGTKLTPSQFHEIGNEKNYLKIAYPAVFIQEITDAANKQSVGPALMYSVIRRESLFNPQAISNRGALGLFQFTPKTFDTLRQRYKLFSDQPNTPNHQLQMDSQSSIQTGAVWFSKELLKRQKGNILTAIMEHNAGYRAVKNWKNNWTKQGYEKDIEVVLANIGFGETRLFTKRVYADLLLTKAVGLFSVPNTDQQEGAGQ